MASPRAIPRVWEVDWSIPASEGGTPWASVSWLAETARDLGYNEVSILAATYDRLGDFGRSLGSHVASRLRSTEHRHVTQSGLTVHGITTRGSWHPRGPVLVAFGGSEVLAEVEGRNPPAIATVAGWPDDIAGWRSAFAPQRIGQVRADQEAQFDTLVVQALDPRAAAELAGPLALVNENHSALSTHERQRLARAFVELRRQRVPVDDEELRTHLMGAGWNGKLIAAAVGLAARVAQGQTPRH